jgi:hypothetical protein
LTSPDRGATVTKNPRKDAEIDPLAARETSL